MVRLGDHNWYMKSAAARPVARDMWRWNFETREYEPYAVPSAWHTPVLVMDAKAVVNCAECGQRVAVGDTYTSRRIHTDYGFAYMVCEGCYSGGGIHGVD